MKEFKASHLRYNPLNGEWVQVSPHRLKRPWQGKTEQAVGGKKRPSYVEDCYLCAGNTRSNGAVNPEYQGVFVFDNDFSALAADTNKPDFFVSEDELFQAKAEPGICRVVCYSPDHGKSMAQLEVNELIQVIDCWIEQTQEMAETEDIEHIQIFENKGAIMGCSNPHPHGQLWAQKSVPHKVALEDLHQKKYWQKHGVNLLLRYAKKEEGGKRVVVENDDFMALVPYWAVWPFETLVLPKRQMARIPLLKPKEREALAKILKGLTQTYDALFNTSFPYSMGIHQAPFSVTQDDYWQWHMHFYPPLLRSATVKKFMVGYEMMGNPQRDFTPEYAADQLRKVFKN